MQLLSRRKIIFLSLLLVYTAIVRAADIRLDLATIQAQDTLLQDAGIAAVPSQEPEWVFVSSPKLKAHVDAIESGALFRYLEQPDFPGKWSFWGIPAGNKFSQVQPELMKYLLYMAAKAQKDGDVTRFSRYWTLAAKVSACPMWPVRHQNVLLKKLAYWLKSGALAPKDGRAALVELKRYLVSPPYDNGFYFFVNENGKKLKVYNAEFIENRFLATLLEANLMESAPEAVAFTRESLARFAEEYRIHTEKLDVSSSDKGLICTWEISSPQGVLKANRYDFDLQIEPNEAISD